MYYLPPKWVTHFPLRTLSPATHQASYLLPPAQKKNQIADPNSEAWVGPLPANQLQSFTTTLDLVASFIKQVMRRISRWRQCTHLALDNAKEKCNYLECYDCKLKRLEHVARFQKSKKSCKMVKTPRYSCIEIKSMTHQLRSGDRVRRELASTRQVCKFMDALQVLLEKILFHRLQLDVVAKVAVAIFSLLGTYDDALHL
ncbi:hypothetical protein OIU78_010265 [Salix suchowensis]|nr:hypothetical protein OIU78_010265 [Salix suchowensis]